MSSRRSVITYFSGVEFVSRWILEGYCSGEISYIWSKSIFFLALRNFGCDLSFSKESFWISVKFSNVSWLSPFFVSESFLICRSCCEMISSYLRIWRWNYLMMSSWWIKSDFTLSSEICLVSLSRPPVYPFVTRVENSSLWTKFLILSPDELPENISV